MAAEMQLGDDFEVVDLDALSVADLLREQATVKAEIVKIEAQLADPTREERLGPHEYRIWRRNALLAHAHFNRERLEIHGALKEQERFEAKERATDRAQRHAEQTAEVVRQSAEARALRAKERAVLTAEERERIVSNSPRRIASEAFMAQMREDRAHRLAAAREAIRGGGGFDGLLLRVAVAMHHLQRSDAEPPDTYDEGDREAVKAMNEYLRGVFGKRLQADIKNGVAPLGDKEGAS